MAYSHWISYQLNFSLLYHSHLFLHRPQLHNSFFAFPYILSYYFCSILLWYFRFWNLYLLLGDHSILYFTVASIAIIYLEIALDFFYYLIMEIFLKFLYLSMVLATWQSYYLNSNTKNISLHEHIDFSTSLILIQHFLKLKFSWYLLN